MADERIEIEDTKDQALLRIAQRATMNDTVLPSGFRTPPYDMIVIGMALVIPDAPEGPRTPRSGEFRR